MRSLSRAEGRGRMIASLGLAMGIAVEFVVPDNMVARWQVMMPARRVMGDAVPLSVAAN